MAAHQCLHEEEARAAAGGPTKSSRLLLHALLVAALERRAIEVPEVDEVDLEVAPSSSPGRSRSSSPPARSNGPRRSWIASTRRLYGAMPTACSRTCSRPAPPSTCARSAGVTRAPTPRRACGSPRRPGSRQWRATSRRQLGLLAAHAGDERALSRPQRARGAGGARVGRRRPAAVAPVARPPRAGARPARIVPSSTASAALSPSRRLCRRAAATRPRRRSRATRPRGAGWGPGGARAARPLPRPARGGRRVRARVRGGARPARRGRRRLRARPHGALPRRAAPPGRSSARGATGAALRARHVRAPGRRRVGRAGATRARGDGRAPAAEHAGPHRAGETRGRRRRGRRHEHARQRQRFTSARARSSTHLRKVFRKLGVRSRTELSRALAAGPPEI